MSTLTQPRRTSMGADARFAAFAAMWALANCVHLANQFIARIDNPAGWANLVAAVLVLLDPRSVRRLVLLAGLQLLEVAWVSPFAPDHAMLAAGVNAAILVCYVRARRTPTAGASTPDAFLDRVAAPSRLLLVVAYAAAAVAKYNTTFLDPVHSCATYLANVASFGLAGNYPALGPWHVATSVAVETLIPLLLLVPATRRAGVRVGIVFHFLVSLSPAMHVGDFSTTLWPLFLVFLSNDELDVIVGRIRRTLVRSPVARWVGALDRRLTSALLIAVAGAAGWLPGATDFGVRATVSLVVFVYGAVILSVVLRPVPPSVPIRRVAFRPTASQALILVAVVLWALNPYLGFRTTASFTMFSNLSTEGPGTNHLFMPSLHLVDHQNDLVDVLGSKDPDFQELADQGQALPFHEFQRAATLLRIDVTGRWRDAVISTTSDALTDASETTPVLLKLWHFRAVPGDGEPRCTN